MDGKGLQVVEGELLKGIEKPPDETVTEVLITSAHVVASRVSPPGQRLRIEYKIDIQTERHGVLVVWYRYKAFYDMSRKLEKKRGYASSQIPKLPAKQILPNLSSFMHLYQVMTLDHFLTAAVNADAMRWGIRVTKDLIAKKPRRLVDTTTPRDSIVSTATTVSVGTDERSYHASFA